MIVRRFAVLAITCAAASASADSKSEAIAMFDRAHADFQAGRTAAACDEYTESLKLFPDSGTKGSLAICYEKLGKIASAWKLWRDLSETGPAADLRADAAERAKQLDSRLSHFVISTAAPVDGLAVTANDSAVNVALSVPLPTDPGKLTVTARAPHRETWTHDFDVAEGATIQISIPELAAKPEPDPVAAPAPSKLARNVVTAGAATAVVAALTFELWGEHTYSQAKSAPDAASQQSKYDSANRERHVSEVFIGVGVACGAIAAWLWLRHDEQPHAMTVAPVVGDGVAGISFGRSW